ncbi:MAG TPA: ATP-binding protein [Candidatus Marinimicrobia bacterium]|nr:ATP-binding protein [Candidatus Neomarinimicrobiota bacterium]HRS51627.1 ATP-binding protein [Candidatus Neomarinimicrobiota bacterium]HRU92295.1 ATP-binding protein [Candidatus Neomarinimicrobiota bacterium]
MKESKIIIISLMLFLNVINILGDEPAVSVIPGWSLKQVFKVPESALYDPERDVIYVSNINGSPSAADGNGFISRVSPDGKVLDLHWIEGLNAPKGMAIYRDTLYVADLNAIARIDLKQGRLIDKIDLKGKFLNDITVDENGIVYCSDNLADIIYIVKNGQPSVWLSGGNYNPNGLLAEKNHLVMLSSSKGTINYIDYKNKTVREVATIGGSLDGVVACDNNYLVSSFPGEIYLVSPDGRSKKILDTKTNKISSADIGYIPAKRLLLVPTFSDNSLMTYQIAR